MMEPIQVILPRVMARILAAREAHLAREWERVRRIRRAECLRWGTCPDCGNAASQCECED